MVTYNPLTGEAKSFLVSKVDQTVNINKLNASFNFSKGEPIFMEVSQKYNEKMIKNLAGESGFQIVHNFFDNRFFFVDSIWKSNLSS